LKVVGRTGQVDRCVTRPTGYQGDYLPAATGSRINVGRYRRLTGVTSHVNLIMKIDGDGRFERDTWGTSLGWTGRGT